MNRKMVLISALLLACLIALSACSGSTKKGKVEDNSSASDPSAVLTRSDVDIVEGETLPDTNTSIGAEAEAFMSGTFYAEGAVFTPGNEGMPLKFAADKSNIQLTTSSQGISFTFMLLDDQTYLISDSSKKYISFSDKLLSVLGLKKDDLTEITQLSQNTGSDDGEKHVQTAVKINGQDGLCTEFVYKEDNDSNTIKMYTIGDTLKQVENYDSEGKLTMQLAFDKVSATIPADQLTLKGYTKSSSIYSFIKDLATG